MSQENVELVRDAFEAWQPNDSEVFAASLDPDFEYHVTYGVEHGVYRGWKATVEAFDRWQEVFSNYRWEPTDYIDAGGEGVIVPFIEHGFGQTSGVQAQQRPAFLCAVRNGRIVRLTEYQSTAEALQAVELEE